ncbi:MAG: hypothetical protein ACI8S6_000688 [Myxococcota bacterium]|jgi:hypothetical protein
MSFYPCPRCASPVLSDGDRCPHCHAAVEEGEGVRVLPILLASLMLTGCGDKDDTDTGEEDTGAVSALYGVATLDLAPAEASPVPSGQSSSIISNLPKS